MRPADQDQESNVYRDVSDFVRGAPVAISTSFAAGVVRHFARVSESRRGYVLIVGHWLVRLSDDEHGWVMQRLPQSPAAAMSRDHLHSVSPETLQDGWDILICRECGREW